MKLLLCTLVLSAMAVFGGDVTGKWSGTLELNHNGESRSSTAYLILKQEGVKITGSVGQNADRQYPIKAGSIEEDRILLEVVPDQGPTLVKFTLKLDGDDHITGDMHGEGGEGTLKATLDVKREK